MVYLKYIWLFFVSIMRKLVNKMPTILSYSFLAFSVIACFFILIPQCFDRVPILPYYISEHELPITYELCGNVIVFDENRNIVNNNVEVFVGGYSKVLSSTEVDLKFSSPITDELFVVIRYQYNESVREYTQLLVIEEGIHVIKEDFVIYA